MTENSLIPLSQQTAPEFFKPNGLDPIIEKIRREVQSFVPDVSSDKGRKEISSMARKVASAKVAIDDLGKEYVADLKSKSAVVDAERKRMRETLDALRDETRQPLTDWEDAEEKRVDVHKVNLEAIAAIVNCPIILNSTEWLGRYEKLMTYRELNFEEFADLAKSTIDNAESVLLAKIDEAKRIETERAELDRLRAESEERRKKDAEDQTRRDEEDRQRKQKEREEEIRKNAEADAKKKAEEDAQRRIDEERRRADEEAEKSKKAEENRLAAEKRAEDDRRAAEEKAERDRIAAEKKAKDDQERAVQAERDRQEEIRRQEAVEAAKREADTKHRKNINNDILKALLENSVTDLGPINTEAAKKIISAIAKGQIPHVKIIY